MKIYLLERFDSADYEEYAGFVIRAEDEKSARIMASKKKDQGDASRWMDDKQTSCEEVNQDGEPDIILDSFNAG